MVSVVVRPMLRIEARTQENSLIASVREVTVNVLGTIYPGPYNVFPSQEEQVLPTTGKTMERDVVVSSVPMSLATRSHIDRLF